MRKLIKDYLDSVGQLFLSIVTIDNKVSQTLIYNNLLIYGRYESV
jgi:hypothetical protein